MTFLVILHGIICVMLAIVILMQAGRRGGLTEAFASAESMLGTKTNAFMVRLTTTLAVLFFTTSLTLTVLSAQKGKSLMSGSNIKPKTSDVAQEPAAAAQTATMQQEIDKTLEDATAQMDALKDNAAQAVESVQDKAVEVKDAVVDAGQAVADKTAEMVDDAKVAVGEAVDKAAEAVGDAGQAVEQAVEQPVVPVQ